METATPCSHVAVTCGHITASPETRHHMYDFTLSLKVLVTTQWEGMGDVGSARYEPALLPPYPTIRVLSYSN